MNIFFKVILLFLQNISLQMALMSLVFILREVLKDLNSWSSSQLSSFCIRDILSVVDVWKMTAEEQLRREPWKREQSKRRSKLWGVVIKFMATKYLTYKVLFQDYSYYGIEKPCSAKSNQSPFVAYLEILILIVYN
jgi:hypothetical protein